VIDPVDRVIAERERLDAGFPGGVLVSLVAHLVLVGAAFAAPLIFPARTLIATEEGFAVPLPRGGGGSQNAAPPVTVPNADTPPPAVEPAKVLKPPKEEPKVPSKSVPELDPRKTRKKNDPAPRAAAGQEAKTASAAAASPGASATPGLAIGPPGPGTPDGVDSGGDWYLAGVQQKIWMLWNQQVKSGFTQPVTVTFTILADGSLADVQLTQSSGASLLDLAAQRAVYSAAPFGPLPKSYGTNRKTIQAVFKPVG
jgi:TonB family protein